MFCDGDESWLFVFMGLCFLFGVFILLYFLDLSIVVVYNVLCLNVCLFGYEILVVVLGRDFALLLTPTYCGSELMRSKGLTNSVTQQRIYTTR